MTRLGCGSCTSCAPAVDACGNPLPASPAPASNTAGWWILGGVVALAVLAKGK